MNVRISILILFVLLIVRRIHVENVLQYKTTKARTINRVLFNCIMLPWCCFKTAIKPLSRFTKA